MNDSTEQQLRREIEDLRRQLRAQHEPHPAGSPAERWRPSGVTITVLLVGLAAILVVAFFAGYPPCKSATRPCKPRPRSARRLFRAWK